MSKYLINQLKEIKLQSSFINEEEALKDPERVRIHTENIKRRASRALQYLDDDLDSHPHFVYLLFKDDDLIYVGCTAKEAFKKRLYDHESNKDFNYYCVIAKSNSKEEALAIEKSIFQFVDSFTTEVLRNVKGTSKDRRVGVGNLKYKINYESQRKY